MSPHDIEQRIIGAAYAYALLAAAILTVLAAVAVYCTAASLARRWRTHRHGTTRPKPFDAVTHIDQVIASDPQLTAGLDRLLNDIHKGDQP